MGGDSGAIDYDRIAEVLEVLANPNRLRALRQLLEPRTVGQVELEAERTGGQGASGAPISREGVRQHLARLRELGVVRRREGPGGAHEYLVDQGALFALMEEIRNLGRLRPDERWLAETKHGAPPQGPAEPEGPRLVVVHGVEEGVGHPLPAGEAPWVVGRASVCNVVLPHDPFVSRRNTRIEKDGEVYRVLDLPESRNGTALNWTPLPDGEPQPLEHGDVVGIGRSLLLFRR